MDDWWKGAVIYQIYPRSFADSDGDGVGDLRGILARLDHLADLGVDAVWISPIYPSPMADFGYDVSDYTGIHPMFGTMDDFDALVAGVHARGLKLLLDFVPGHTSEAHPWFEASRSSKDDPKRGWYTWRDARDGGPPTNWIAEFGGPAWEWDAATGQYYHHAFLPEQPNLNWRNPEAVAALMDAMRFWYDRGVDGFRVDAFEQGGADPEAGNNPPNPDWTPAMNDAESLRPLHTKHQPVVFDMARRMRAVAGEYAPERLLVGEIYANPVTLARYYGDAAGAMFQLPFNFALIDMAWDAGTIGAFVEEYEAALPPDGWPSWVLGNHDRARMATRFGAQRVRAALTLLLTLRGTPTLYYGEEIGMGNVHVPPDRVQDPWELRVPGKGFGRDVVRTPMPWERGPGMGFTSGDPWLPLGAPEEGTVAEQAAREDSTLAFTKRLLRLRRDTEALRVGGIEVLGWADDVLRYVRTSGGDRVEVAVNFAAAPRPAPEGTVLLSTHAGEGDLRPDEARVVRVG